jgi:Zn-dependent peptidase ImmA (M78 family)
MRRADAEVAAADLLKRYGIAAVPVPVEQVARGEGAQVVRQRFEGSQSGFVYRIGDRTIIGVNSATSARRQRFTIAHELGHMLLHQDDALMVDNAVQFRDERSSLAIDPEEIEANTFAAALLMPAEQVLAHVKAALAAGISSREKLIGRLAQTFDVSAEAMGYRLVNLGILSS